MRNEGLHLAGDRRLLGRVLGWAAAFAGIGIVFGYVSLIEGMVGRIQKELPEKAKVILTGGFLDIISRESSVFDVVNPNLILIGLKLVYEMNKG